jgi:hypothetical protein
LVPKCRKTIICISVRGAAFPILQDSISLFGSSLLCVGNGKIELSGDEVDDGDQISG